MFRRPGKNDLDQEAPAPLYKEEPHLATPFKYGAKKMETFPTSEIPPRIFDRPSSTPGPVTLEPMDEEQPWKSEKTTPLSHHFQGVMNEEVPETTLGEGVVFRGQLSFERLLRIDGIFEGELLSQGKVIVGPKGKIKANLNLREAIIEGKVEGNITIQERLELRGEAIVYGDISAKSLSVDEGVTIVGHLKITPKEEEDNESSTPLLEN